MYTLYYSPGVCSMAVHVILNETGQNAKLEKVDLRAPRSPEFLKLNPRGQVPVLLEDGKPILEGAAMITYLCDKYKSALLPQTGFERAKALQWLMFANSTLHASYSRAASIARQNADDAAKKPFLDAALDHIQTLWDQVETSLSADGPYLCGKNPTAGDILIAVIANWSFLPRQFNFGPKTKALLKSISARPAYQAALKAEEVEYKAAA